MESLDVYSVPDRHYKTSDSDINFPLIIRSIKRSLKSTKERRMWKCLVLLTFVLLQQCCAGEEASKGEFREDLFEGDIKMPLSEILGRAGTKQGTWPNGILYYQLSSGITGSYQAMTAFNAAKREWEEKTNNCIQLKERRSSNRNYVEFVTGKGGCYSNSIGMRGYGRQEINLDSGCWHKGTVVHEIGHALGYWHEQSRVDRDNYIQIKWENIKPGRESQFRKVTGSHTHDTPYDYASIMHYPKWAFQKAQGYDTIVPLRQGVTIGQRNSLSVQDVKQMKIMYGCDGTRPTRPSGSCRDNKKHCGQLTRYCDDKNYKDFMTKNCKKTCRFCQSSTCRDTDKRCHSWTSYCNSSDHVKKHCKKTCRFCVT